MADTYRFYSCEFEFQKADDGCVLAWPFWKGYLGCTQGRDMDEAYEMAKDLLKRLVETCVREDRPTPPLTVGNRPRHGGIVMPVNYSEATDR